MVLKVLDVVQQVCPFPLIEAKSEMDRLNPGDRLLIEFDCTQATESIPRWAAEEGHRVVDYHKKDNALWSITLEKAA